MLIGLLVFVIALAFGYTAGSIAESKGHRFWWYFILGFALPVIGAIVAAVIPANDHSPAA